MLFTVRKGSDYFLQYKYHQNASIKKRKKQLHGRACGLGQMQLPCSNITSELADIDWDNLGFGFTPTDCMYVMKCSEGENFSKGELHCFSNIEELLEGLKVYRKYDGNILLLLPEENAMHLKMSVERTCMPSPSAEQFVEAVKATVLSQERWPVSRCVCCYTYATDSVNDNGRTGYFAKTIWRIHSAP
ncbi:branched-chain amino acid aminotransferase 2, chloroplastic-like isoform X2 [Nicotiana tomentosiformis]|uniref:branched-chain amino acid aminotransferase 2, chloroplastic-like isoform X2 n=1 Tax=Nicotiana tomentosiformis TaxID=4098 RepID=UPI00051B86FF|nr:branched-chain amino acid aminotransferase 2, chloroplastic-like isoform X2 [Nicotiana tomentosiformis]